MSRTDSFSASSPQEIDYNNCVGNHIHFLALFALAVHFIVQIRHKNMLVHMALIQCEISFFLFIGWNYFKSGANMSNVLPITITVIVRYTINTEGKVNLHKKQAEIKIHKRSSTKMLYSSVHNMQISKTRYPNISTRSKVCYIRTCK